MTIATFFQNLWVSLLMNSIICRIFQFFFNLGLKLLYYPKPKIIEGNGCIDNDEVSKILIEREIASVLVVTDKGLSDLHLPDTLLQSFERNKIDYVYYDKTVANPTIDNVEEALKLYNDNKCKAIIGFGGGSPIDCAKGVGARVARPRKTITQMRGVLRVHWPTPPIIAIPTTSGTGSEVTAAAVITDSKTHEKYALSDIFLIPRYIILDPTLTVKCPPHITSTTGMDALTHAVESYINNHNTRDTNKAQIEAIQLIFENICNAYTNGTDIKARANMQRAAFLAGYAFTRKFIGNVHAIAHQLGGMYGTPHGLANAVILPYVLESYGKNAHKRLAELCVVAKLNKTADDTDAEHAAHTFIDAIKDLNKRMNIPTKLTGIKGDDIPLLAYRAAMEANPMYPVPRIFSFKDFENVLNLIKVD